MPLPQYIVRLTADEHVERNDLIRTGKRAVSVLLHARLLLKADAGADGPGWDDASIAEAMECGASTVSRVRQAFVEAGLTAALFRKKPTGRQYRKLDGAQEAHLIALACGVPPAGRSHWNLRLLADRLVELAVVLNTQKPAALYQAFEHAMARSLIERLELHYTPKHGSGLNRAEIELSVLSRQCLDCHIPDVDTLTQEIAAWEQARNANVRPVNRRFTTPNVRLKLKRLYPSIQDGGSTSPAVAGTTVRG